MKISALTISLIIFALISLSMFYTYKLTFDMQKDLCGKIDSMDILNTSDSEYEMIKDCYYQQQIAYTKYGLTMFVTTIFIFLIIISFKIDYIKKH